MLANLGLTHQLIEVLFSLFHDKLISLFHFLSLPLSLSLTPLITEPLSSSSFSLGPFFIFFSSRFTGHFFLICFLKLFFYFYSTMQFEGFLLQGLWSEIALYCGFEFFFLVILLSMLFFVACVLQDWSKIASWNCWVNSF